MISPDTTVPLLQEPMAIPQEHHGSRRFTSAIQRVISKLTLESRLARLQSLVQLLDACNDRSEFTGLVGRPLYALPGIGFSKYRDDGTKIVPDRVEMFELGWCQIQLWFLPDGNTLTVGGLHEK